MSAPIKAFLFEQSETINFLAGAGKIKPVDFTTPDGIRRSANSCWAASDWLKSNGWYARKDSGPIIWHV